MLITLLATYTISSLWSDRFIFFIHFWKKCLPYIPAWVIILCQLFFQDKSNYFNFQSKIRNYDALKCSKGASSVLRTLIHQIPNVYTLKDQNIIKLNFTASLLMSLTGSPVLWLHKSVNYKGYNTQYWSLLQFLIWAKVGIVLSSWNLLKRYH